jgi:hypothetical protein
VCRSITARSSRVSGLDDRLRHAHLAHVVQERRKLRVTPLARAEPELVRDAQRHVDHVATVHAGVGVVRLDDVAEQEGGAAVGVTQLQLVVDPYAALAGEDRQQRDERQREHDTVRRRL